MLDVTTPNQDGNVRRPNPKGDLLPIISDITQGELRSRTQRPIRRHRPIASGNLPGNARCLMDKSGLHAERCLVAEGSAPCWRNKQRIMAK
jgi:hypothetical protein